MRVGVISHGSPDYLIDIVCDGLIKILGRSNVALDYLHKRRWGGQYCILMAGVETENTFDIHDADILVASDRSIPKMNEWLSKTGKAKVALIDGEDDTQLRYDPAKVSVYFKREYLKGKSYANNVIPLPFAAIEEQMPEGVQIEREVFYQGHDSNEIRPKVRAALIGAGYKLPAGRVDKSEYNKALMSSLIGVSVRGCGWDTYRYWEIPFFGCTLLSQRLGIVIPGDFEEDREAVFFNNEVEMLEKLSDLASNPDKALKIGAAGRKACLSRHMSSNRAKTVLEAIA